MNEVVYRKPRKKRKRLENFYYVDDLQELCQVSRTKAFSILHILNAELQEKGYMTFSGRISKKYFYERCKPLVDSGAVLQAVDVQELTGYSESAAYNLIRELNAELETQGWLTIRGRLPKDYFYKRCVPMSKKEAG